MTSLKGANLAFDQEDNRFADNLVTVLINPFIDDEVMKTLITIDGKVDSMRAISIGFSYFNSFQNHFSVINIDYKVYNKFYGYGRPFKKSLKVNLNFYLILEFHKNFNVYHLFILD